MIKQTQLFLSADDEVALSSALLVVRPRLAFVDDSRWDTPAPVLASSIATCKSKWVFLWDQSIIAPFLGLPRKDGKFDGPAAGWVIEVTRSTMQGDLMLSGRIAASTGVPDKQIMAAMDAFVADVWKVLKKATQPVVAVDPQTANVINDSVPEFRAGHGAAAWALSAPEHYFRSYSTQHFFKPKTPA